MLGIRNLGQEGSQVQPRIVVQVPHSQALPIIKHKVTIIASVNRNVDHIAGGVKGTFMYMRPLTPSVGDLLARCKKPLVCVLLLLRRVLFVSKVLSKIYQENSSKHFYKHEKMLSTFCTTYRPVSNNALHFYTRMSSFVNSSFLGALPHTRSNMHG